MFADNFKTFEGDVAPAVKAAGPGCEVRLGTSGAARRGRRSR